MKKNRQNSRLLLIAMKISVIQLALATVFTSFSYGFDTKAQEFLNKSITLKVVNIKLRDVLGQIEKQAQVKFVYSSKAIKADRKLNFSSSEQRLSEVLETLLKPINVGYKVIGGQIILNAGQTALAPITNEVNTIPETMLYQERTITGKVIDAEKGEALPGVSITIKGTQRGTSTDNNGKYSLTVPDDAEALVFSFVGYDKQEQIIGKRIVIDVSMRVDIKSLDEVVVVGYGSQLKKEITGSIQNVSAKEFKDIPVPQITQKLQGKLAGVQIIQGTGRPGEGMQVRIRGQASISAQGQPLYVVDGFPIVGDISSINPNEIESISVLKDASSSSLYGSRAAFGVVLIETKRAKSGQTNLSVNAYYGLQSVPEKGRPNMMNATEFAQFRKEVYQFNNQPVPTIYQNPSQYGEGTNWYNVLLRTAPIQDYSISLSSGKDKFSTSATAGVFSQDGVILNSGFQRLSLRLNSEYKFNDHLKLGFNVAPTYSIYNGTLSTDGELWGGSIIQNAILTTPLAPYQNQDGTLPLTTTMEGLFPNPNWYRVVQEVEAKRNNFRLLSNAYLEYELIKDLYLKTSMNIDLGQNSYSRFSPSTTGNIFAPPPQKATGQLDNSNYYSWLTENTATYKKTIDAHSFDVLAGYTVQRFRSDYSSVQKTDYPDDRIRILTAGATTTSSTSDIQEWSLLSYLTRLNYSYKNKYLLSAVVRRDGSSRFGTNNKWGNFPSISAGWVASDEPFMANVKNISFLKLRTSYGLTGNNNLGNYPYYAAVNTANYVFNGALANGRAVSSLSNLDLGWERTKQFDLGVDIGLFNDKLSITYDYYKKNTDGLLFGVPIPIESGYNNVTVNLGEFEFWGHEFTISSKNLTQQALKWNTDFNISFNDNKVLKLGSTDAPVYGNGTITRVGDRIGQFFGFKFDGVYKNQQEFDSAPKYATSAVGTVRMKDINGDNKITNTNDDKTIIGNPFPTFIFGITNSFNYKNFDLSIVAAGSYGNDIMNRTLEYTQNLDGVFNVTKDVARRWKSEQDPGDGLHPSVKSGTTDLARFINSRWVSKGSYLTIKNITLGYNFPLKNNKYFRNVRAYGSIQQALVLTNYDGANPEVSSSGGNALSQGVDFTAYPVPRTITFGLSLSL